MIADHPAQWGTAPAPGAPSRWLSFNINETVRAKLTPEGLAEYRRQHEELNKQPWVRIPLPVEPKLDAEGYYSCQLWSLMRDFGHMLMLGASLPFETIILLPAHQLEPPAA